MSDDPVFVDTNILVYAHDADAGERHQDALSKVTRLWGRAVLPSISIQVLQELYVNLIKRKVDGPVAAEVVINYLEWDVVDNDRPLLQEGMRLSMKFKLSFWDALIVAAARKAKAKEIWTEDLNAGQDYEGVVVVNPFMKE